jgi:hypothetical protein
MNWNLKMKSLRTRTKKGIQTFIVVSLYLSLCASITLMIGYVAGVALLGIGTGWCLRSLAYETEEIEEYQVGEFDNDFDLDLLEFETTLDTSE